MTWLVPVLLDGGLVVMALTATVRRARGESARFAWTVLCLLTGGSMAAQVAHVLAEPATAHWQAVAGAVLAASFPALVFASTHALLDLAVAPAPKRGRRPQAAKAKAVSAPVTASAPAPTREPLRPVAALEKASGVPSVAVPGPAGDTAADREAQRARVLELRAQGLPFSQVAEEAQVPLSTAKRWCATAA